MKKLLLAFLIIAFSLSGLVLASNVSDVPQAGLWKSGLSGTQVKGAICQIGKDTFQYVYNGAGTVEYQGEPAYLDWAHADGYTVGPYLATASIEAFAGIWYCDAYGVPIIESAAYGWIQTKGVCTTAYLSQEAGTAIAIGDVLAGCTPVNGTAGTAGYYYLHRVRAAYTAETIVTGEGRALVRYPRALAGYSSTSGAGTILLGY